SNDEHFIKNNLSLIIQLCMTLTNICAVGQLRVRASLIRQTDILKYLLQLYQMTTIKNLKKSILEFFNMTLEGRDNCSKTEVLRTNVLELFNDELNSDSNE